MHRYFDICHSIDILIHGPGNLPLTLRAADGMTNVVAERQMVVTNLVDVRLGHKCKCHLCNCEMKIRLLAHFCNAINLSLDLTKPTSQLKNELPSMSHRLRQPNWPMERFV